MEPRSEERRGGGERGGGHLNLLSPLVPGPVTVTWGERGGSGELVRDMQRERERERERPDGARRDLNPEHIVTLGRAGRGVMGNPRYVMLCHITGVSWQTSDYLASNNYSSKDGRLYLSSRGGQT